MFHLYRILIKEQLESHWSAAFSDLTITSNADGATLLTGSLADQAALFGILSRVRDLNLTLLALNRIEPRMEICKEQKGAQP